MLGFTALPPTPPPPQPDRFRAPTKDDIGKLFLVRSPYSGNINKCRVLGFSPEGKCVELGGDDLDITLQGWFFPLHVELIEELK